MERIYSEPLNNSYPKKFIDRVKARITTQAPLDRNWTSTVCISYVPKVSQLVYKLLCQDCTAVYIGETSRSVAAAQKRPPKNNESEQSSNTAQL